MTAVALVTGAGGAIGRAIACELAAAGTAVALVARARSRLEAVAEEIAGRGGRALAIACDVRDEDAVRRAVAQATGEVGPIDLLVNNAGTLASGPLWEIPPGDWWRDVEVSVRGAFLCTRAVLPGMLERRSGRIVNMSSRLGARSEPWCSGYACAKAALMRMTECLAAEVAGRGMHVFALSPGLVLTNMTRAMRDSAWHGDRLRAIPEEKWSPPELAASMVVRIAAGDADPLSGRILDAPTGLDAQLEQVDQVIASDRLTLRLRE